MQKLQKPYMVFGENTTKTKPITGKSKHNTGKSKHNTGKSKHNTGNSKHNTTKSKQCTAQRLQDKLKNARTSGMASTKHHNSSVSWCCICADTKKCTCSERKASRDAADGQPATHAGNTHTAASGGSVDPKHTVNNVHTINHASKLQMVGCACTASATHMGPTISKCIS
jgi:hypothetical protein